MKIAKAKVHRDGVIKAEVDGVEVFIPQDTGNRHYRALLEANIKVEEADPDPTPSAPPLTVEDLLEELKARGVVGPEVTVETVRQRRRERLR